MDLQEFKIKVLPVNKKLFRLAIFMLKDKEEAEDLLQDVMLKLWTNRDKLKEYDSPEAFAMRVTKNLCLDRLKSGKLRNKVDISTMEFGSGETDPYKRFELSDTVSKVQLIMDRLPEQQKLIIHLRDIEGLSFEEIESITGLNVNNIRVNLSRARKSVRDGYTKIDNYEIG